MKKTCLIKYDIFEYDCIVKTPGTLHYGDYKIKCYVISSNTSVAGIGQEQILN